MARRQSSKICLGWGLNSSHWESVEAVYELTALKTLGKSLSKPAPLFRLRASQASWVHASLMRRIYMNICEHGWKVGVDHLPDQQKT